VDDAYPTGFAARCWSSLKLCLPLLQHQKSRWSAEFTAPHGSDSILLLGTLGPYAQQLTWIYLQEKHTSLQQQEAKLSGEVAALQEEVASLKTRAVNAEQHATELEQQLASEAETGKATLEALEKQSETLQVCVRSLPPGHDEMHSDLWKSCSKVLCESL